MELSPFAGKMFNLGDSPSEGNLNKCDIYYMKTDAFMIYRGYEGIPENLIINVVVWVILLILFGILRKRAWNHRKTALVQRSDPTWIELFYGEPNAFCDTSSESTADVDEISLQPVEKGCCTWLSSIFKVKDAEIFKRCGRDAVQYLSFQRHCIVYTCIICIFSLVVILPVNMHGDMEIDTKSFAITTLSNLNPNSNLLWVHVTLAMLFLPLGILFMRHFSANLSMDDKAVVGRTLMISGIPPDSCSKPILLQHFQEAYPDSVVQDLQFACDIRLLRKLERKRKNATRARIWCENAMGDGSARPQLRPYVCGRLCCCPGCKKVDALTYYSEEEIALNAAVDRERSVALQKPLGIAFITFRTEAMSEQVYKDFGTTFGCRCISNPPNSSISRRLALYDWQVAFAPPPQDILWGNLAASPVYWWLRMIVIHFFLFLMFIFLTTPPILFEYLDLIYFQQKAETLVKFSAVLSGFLPTFLLWTVSIIMPFLVTYSDELQSHWTRSEYNHSVMKKAFFFLLFMIVILPSLGLTSAKGLIDWALLKNNETFHWQCVFLPDNGALFVKYVTTSSFVGSALELIRFPELFIYALYLFFSKSEAETCNVRRDVMWEFAFGVHYTWYLLNFAMIIFFSLSCPLIVPFGLVYLVFKHCVDRHNIYFVYSPSKINAKIHTMAINIVVVTPILQQMCLFFFSSVRAGWTNVTIAFLAMFVITLLIFLGQLFFSLFQQFSPIIYKRLTRRTDLSGRVPDSDPTSDSHIYIPEELKKDSGMSCGDLYRRAEGSSRFGYGTSEDSIPSSPVKTSNNTEVETGGIQEESSQGIYQRF